MREVYDLFFNPGEVVEIRAIGGLSGKNKAWSGYASGAKAVVSGYFDNAEAFAEAATALDKAGAIGVYFTLNPVKKECLARSVNRLKTGVNTTTDQEIACIRWAPIDLDPARPSGISSSDEELQGAAELAKQVIAWFEGRQWPQPVKAMSGNGYHLVYRLPDWPNHKDSVICVQKILAAVASECKDAQGRVAIDQKVFNPARIWKIYGSTARKGDHTKERPHRKSFLFPNQPTKLDEVPIV